MNVTTPLLYIDKIIRLNIGISKIGYKALGSNYALDKSLTDSEIVNKDYYYIHLNQFSSVNGSRYQTALKCNLVAKQFIDLISNVNYEHTFESLVIHMYNLYKDTEDSSTINEVSTATEELLDELYTAGLLKLTDVVNSNITSDSNDDVTEGAFGGTSNENDAESSETPPESSNDVTNDDNQNPTEIETEVNSAPILGVTKPDTSTNTSTPSADVIDVPDNTRPSEYEMRQEIAGVPYDYSFRIKNGFTVTKLGDYYYIMPYKENDTSRWFIKTNYFGAVGLQCFRNLTNRQRVIDIWKQVFPDESDESLFENATYLYNCLWFDLEVCNSYKPDDSDDEAII